MKPWIRLTLIVMTVGGGFSGFARTLEALFDSSRASTLNQLFKVVFLGLYAFVAASGLLFVQDPTRTGTLRAALATDSLHIFPVHCLQVCCGPCGIFKFRQSRRRKHWPLYRLGAATREFLEFLSPTRQATACRC